MDCEKVTKNHYVAAFFFTLIISVGLMIGSFFMPPKGTIDSSVLKASAEMFMWPTLAFGLKAIGVCNELKRKKKSQEGKDEE